MKLPGQQMLEPGSFICFVVFKKFGFLNDLLTLQKTHLAHTLGAYGTFLEFLHLVHGAAEYTFGTVPFKDNVIALNEYFNGVALVHQISFAQRFGKHNTSKLVYFSYNTCRFHHIHLFYVWNCQQLRNLAYEILYFRQKMHNSFPAN